MTRPPMPAPGDCPAGLDPHFWALYSALAGIARGNRLGKALASEAARQAARGLGRALDPDKEIRAARAALEELGTAKNRKRLADALVVRGHYGEAREIYEATLTGAHANDLRKSNDRIERRAQLVAHIRQEL